MRAKYLLVLVSGIAISAFAEEKAGKPTTSLPAAKPTVTKPADAKDSSKSTGAAVLPVIGFLETNDRSITIKSGPKGAVYSVATKEGKVLFEDVSAEKLRAEAPELHQILKTGVAKKSGQWTDARIDFKAR